MDVYFKQPFTAFLDKPPSSVTGRIIQESRFVQLGANQMIRDLGLDNIDTERPDRVDEYIAQLENQYHLVMIMEHMDKSLILMRHLLGWDLQDIVSLPMNQQQRRSSKDALEHLTQGQRENLRKINSADHALYRRFYALFEMRLAEFGNSRMEAELDAYRCLNNAVYDACQVTSYRAADLPKIYKPYGDTVGFFPAIEYGMSSDLLWLCPRITSIEVSYIEQLRLKQRYIMFNNAVSPC
jgi:hypothetical protein